MRKNSKKNTKKSNRRYKKSNKKFPILVIVILLICIVLCVFGFLLYNKYNNNNSNTNSKNEYINYSENKKSKKKKNKNDDEQMYSDEIKSSSAKEPANFNEWVFVSKKVSKDLSDSYKNTSYVDIPARITTITRGSEADAIIKELINNKTLDKFEEPTDNTENIVVDYDIDLSNLTFDEDKVGILPFVSSDIKGLNGYGLKYKSVSYSINTKDISSTDYAKEPKIYNCRFICTLPKGCIDYLITLGDNYDGTIGYIKGE